LFLQAAKKYRRFTEGKAHQLQCKALQRREKSRRRKNNGEQEKTMRRTMETGGNPGACWRIAWSYRHPAKTIARRREAPGA
jgi:uncharacterized protein with von Willebrand factor type A (vWA) domain